MNYDLEADWNTRDEDVRYAEEVAREWLAHCTKQPTTESELAAIKFLLGNL